MNLLHYHKERNPIISKLYHHFSVHMFHDIGAHNYLSYLQLRVTELPTHMYVSCGTRNVILKDMGKMGGIGSQLKQSATNVHRFIMMTSWNGNIFRVTGPLCGEFTGPGEFPHKVQWREALVFSLSCAWINGRVNNRVDGDLRRHRSPYDVIVMTWENGRYWISTKNKAPQMCIISSKERKVSYKLLRFTVNSSVYTTYSDNRANCSYPCTKQCHALCMHNVLPPIYTLHRPCILWHQ